MEKLCESLPPLTLIPSASIKDISISSCTKTADHFSFIVKVIGKTRFLHCISSTHHFVEYQKAFRYSVLRELHKELEKELQPYLKASGKKMPSFPSKSWFSSGRKLAEKRVVLLNEYFSQLFAKYSGVLLHSNALIDFFEPTRIDLSILGLEFEESKAFINSLAILIDNLKVLKTETYNVAHIGLDYDRCDILSKADGKEKILQKVIPFDYPYSGKIYRVDVQNLYSLDLSLTPRDNLLDLYQTPHTACILAFRIDNRKSFFKVQEFLGSIKLAQIDGGVKIPPLILVGLGWEQTKHEVKYEEVANFLKDLFGDPYSFGYVEASYVTGYNVLESIEALLHFTERLRGIES